MMFAFNKKSVPEGIREDDFTCQREGLSIGGKVFRPQGNKLPIAIICHGFMAWQDTVRQYAILLAQQGYAAFTFDFNGGSVIRSKSDGKTTEMSVLTEVKDLEAVIEYVRTLDYVDPDQILQMGCSQGGLVSALVAAKNKYPIQKLCLFYPALCIPDDARSGKMMAAKFDPDHVPQILKCGPMKLGRQYVADVLNMDPNEEIKGYNGQVLLVHGNKDKTVNIEYSVRAKEAYLSALPEGMTPQERIQFCTIEGGAHGFSKKHDAIAMGILQEWAGK